MDWNDVRYFLALARTGSARGAGAALGVSHSTVVRRLEALEASLSTRLFDRSRDGYAITAAGREMLAQAERVEVEMAALERGIAGRDERLAGPVSITCTDDWVSGILLAELAPFCATHPEIELRLENGTRYFDIGRREADIALRAVAIDGSPTEWLLGMHLVPIVLASYVGRAHAARLDPDLAPGRSNGSGRPTRWLGFDDEAMMRALVAETHHAEVAIWGRFSSIGVLRQAASEGLGIVMLPTYVGDPDPALQRLVRPDVRHKGDLWMVSHPDLRDNARLRATRMAIADGLRRRRALFAGAAAGAQRREAEVPGNATDPAPA